jgi:hypothetical protein
MPRNVRRNAKEPFRKNLGQKSVIGLMIDVSTRIRMFKKIVAVIPPIIGVFTDSK